MNWTTLTSITGSTILRADQSIATPEAPPLSELIEQDIKPVIFHETSDKTPSILNKLDNKRGLTQKDFWDSVIEDIEHEIYCESDPRIPQIDYSIVLPPRLRARVRRITPYEFSEDDLTIYIKDDLLEEMHWTFQSKEESGDEEMDEMEKKLHSLDFGQKKKEHVFNESQFSDIVRMDHEYEPFDLKLDEPVGHTAVHVEPLNWMAKYTCIPREDRIIWKSRLYKTASQMGVKTLDEQAEDLMDASAERFMEWLNSVSKAETSLTKEKLKDLFSIKGDRTLLASVKTDPKEVNAIAKTVADKWNKPSMAIELQYEAHINDRSKRDPGPVILSAFGRTIPSKDRPWHKTASDKPIRTVFPEELLTREHIFKGIRHLRSTAALIDFYRSRPNLPRPEYLIAMGDFDQSSDDLKKREVPLYERLGLKY